MSKENKYQEMSVSELRDAVKAKYSKHWELNDQAHRYEHFWEVELCGNEINDVLGLKIAPKLIMLGAFFHDLFAWSRINHHELSAIFVATTDCEIISSLSESDRHLLSHACLHHRASYKGNFTYTIEELINSADRMFPVSDVTSIVERSLLCSLNKTNHPIEAAKLTYDHMKEKFGTGGYARYPAMYQKVFTSALLLQQQQIDALTNKDVIDILLKFKPEFKFDSKTHEINHDKKHYFPVQGDIPRYYVDVNHCDCHPETCCCDDYAIFDRGPNGDTSVKPEKIATAFTRSKAKRLMALYNKDD